MVTNADELQSAANDLSRSGVVDGTIHVPAFDLPPSIFMSAEGNKLLLEHARLAAAEAGKGPPRDIEELRALRNRLGERAVNFTKGRYAVEVQPQSFGGVDALVITPKEGIAPENRDRVLINLHGGGFVVGRAGDVGLVESMPLAAMGRIRVISVDYRLGPEHKFPAACEDGVAVYKALLSSHRPQDIGLFGCTVGGLMTTQILARLQKEGLPTPGAAAVFSSGADAAASGDSYFFGPALAGRAPAPPDTGPIDHFFGYFGGHDLRDPMLSPVFSAEILAKFPPTALLTGSRALDLSSCVKTHAELIKADVVASLHIWDGLGHSFMVHTPDLPESQEAYGVAAKFFQRHLGG